MKATCKEPTLHTESGRRERPTSTSSPHWTATAFAARGPARAEVTHTRARPGDANANANSNANCIGPSCASVERGGRGRPRLAHVGSGGQRGQLRIDCMGSGERRMARHWRRPDRHLLHACRNSTRYRILLPCPRSGRRHIKPVVGVHLRDCARDTDAHGYGNGRANPHAYFRDHTG